jgi:hypothetical protein
MLKKKRIELDRQADLANNIRLEQKYDTISIKGLKKCAMESNGHLGYYPCYYC